MRCIDTLTSDTCLCGTPEWHVMIHQNVLWCIKCGCGRPIFVGKWYVPLDRAADLPRATIPRQQTMRGIPRLEGDVADEESPTRPGTPEAKKL